MSKRTKWAVVIGAVAAVISAVVLIVLFWDKLLEKFPCCCRWAEEPDEIAEDEEDQVVSYEAEELSDYADLQQPEAE